MSYCIKRLLDLTWRFIWAHCNGVRATAFPAVL